MLVYTSSRDSQLCEFYLNRELRFGGRGGSQFGYATYALLDPPEQSLTTLKKETRDVLYGQYLYEFDIDDSKLFFLIFDAFKKTPTCDKLKSTQQSFIKDQFNNLSIPVPSDDIMSCFESTETLEPTTKQAMNLFRWLSRYYYQNEDGRLNTPINGFIYYGKRDGKTAVILNPYSMKPLRISFDNGNSWTSINNKDERYIDYLEHLDDSEYTAEINEGNKHRIFDGNETEIKNKIYRLLMAYNSDDATMNKATMANGLFKNIVIKDDGTIDLTYTSNMPLGDKGHNLYRMFPSPFIEEIHNLGWKIGNLEGGLKFGSESSKEPLYTTKDCPDWMWPDSITEGIAITKENIDVNLKIKTKMLGLKELYLVKCNIESSPKIALQEWKK
jgi:hypothetical protein